jgi:hypothetical protein
MKFNAGVKYEAERETGHGVRPLIHLEGVDGNLVLDVPFGSGAYLRLTELLKAADWGAWDRALSSFGSIQPAGTIELDSYELSNLSRPESIVSGTASLLR